jgi:hypothetical protein
MLVARPSTAPVCQGSRGGLVHLWRGELGGALSSLEQAISIAQAAAGGERFEAVAVGGIGAQARSKFRAEIAAAVDVPNSHAPGGGPTHVSRCSCRTGTMWAGTARMCTPTAVFDGPIVALPL